MSDLIDRRAAIETVDFECGEWRGLAGTIVNGLKNLPTANRWIPCKERLPDKDGEHLVTFEKGYAEDYCFSDIGIAPFEVDCEGFGIWQEHFHPVSLGSLGSEWVEIPVTAWMPLPESYGGDKDDE